MLNQEALNYIHQSQTAGLSNEVIRQNLVTAGWPIADIESAFTNNSTIVSSVSTIPVAVTKKSSVIKALGIIFIILMVLGVGGWFLINRALKNRVATIPTKDLKPTDSRTGAIDVLPMYGGYQKTETEKKADTDFITTASQVPGGRKSAAAGIIQKKMGT